MNQGDAFSKPQMNTDNHGENLNGGKAFIHKEITKNILDSAFRVHNAVGCGLLEKVYGNALVWDLTIKKRNVQVQREFKVIYREKEVGQYFADIVVDESVIVEVKSVEKIDDVHRAQLLNYLRISSIRVGLIINFAKPKLDFERLIV